MESRNNITLYSYDTYTGDIRSHVAVQQHQDGYYTIEFDNGGTLSGNLESFCSSRSRYGLTPRSAVINTIKIKLVYLYRHSIILPHMIVVWFKLLFKG